MAREVPRISLQEVAARELLLDDPDEPLLIEDGARDFPAVSSWNLTSLSERLGHVPIAYKLSTSNAHPDFRHSDPTKMFARGQASFAEFLASISRGPEAERARRLFTGDEQFSLRRRQGRTCVNPDLAPLLDDIAFPTLLPEARLQTIWSWFSGPGVRTWLHYDNNGCHNLNAQITGHKRCWLFPPKELSRLHPFPLGGDNPAHNCSQIDVERLQPRFAADFFQAECWGTELQPGNLLFIPAWWFHTFLHVGDFNSNVNFWWKPLRPTWNIVAARQFLVETALAAKPALSAALLQSEWLRGLDAAAVRHPLD